MKCPVHGERDVIGYCADCGVFGCDHCIVASDGGETLCAKCRKKRPGSGGLVSKLFGEKTTPKPKAGKASFEKSSVARQSRAGRKLEVHFRDGRIIKGSTYKLDPNAVGFHLVPLEPVEGSDRLQVNFSELTAIHVLRDFSGGAESAGDGQQAGETSAEGEEIKVAFRDGEILEGYAMHRFDPTCRRLFIVPKQSVGGSISILVERSALKGLEIEGFTEGIYAVTEEEAAQGDEGKKKSGRAPLSQNESMGDLYFSMKNYDAALAEYDKIRGEFPDDKRLGMKIAVCNFNRGVNFVKSRKYVEAKAEFEKVGKDDPIYGKAKKKIRKIEKVLKDAETLGG